MQLKIISKFFTTVKTVEVKLSSLDYLNLHPHFCFELHLFFTLSTSVFKFLLPFLNCLNLAYLMQVVTQFSVEPLVHLSSATS